MTLNVTLENNPEAKTIGVLQDGHIDKVVISGIFQPLQVDYKYELIGNGGVDVPMDSISWLNSDNGTEVPLGNSSLFNEIKKVCCEDALRQ